ATGPYGGILRVGKVKVWKKDVTGAYQQVIGIAGANAVEVAAPADPSAAVRLNIRPQGGNWTDAALVNFGDAFRFDGAGFGVGDSEYRVLVTDVGFPERTTATGTLNVAPAPLAVIGTPINTLPAGYLGWQAPGHGITQVFRCRPVGGADWATLS